MKRWTLAKRRDFIISILLHALLLIVVYVLQSMILPFLRFNGFVPLLLPIAVAGVAVYEGRYVGGVTGIFAGILCDISFNEPAAVFTVLLTVAGLLVGALTDTVMMRGLATFFLCSIAVLAFSLFALMFTLLFFEGVPPRPLLTVALWQIVYSLLFVFPLWFFVKALGRRAMRFVS